MRQMRAGLAGVAALLLVAGCAGCGGGARPNHGEYTSEVGRICRHANDDLGAVELRRLRGPEAAEAVDELVVIGRAALDDLRAEKPPNADEAKVDEWLATLEQVLDEGAYASSLLRSGEGDAAFRAAARASVLAERAHALGRTFGVPDACRVPSLVDLD
jgi:hypothetical protein